MTIKEEIKVIGFIMILSVFTSIIAWLMVDAVDFMIILKTNGIILGACLFSNHILKPFGEWYFKEKDE